MNKLITVIAVFAVTLSFSCGAGGSQDASDSLKGDSQALLISKINTEETKMRSSETFDPQQALGALRLYTEFCTKYPNDSMTAEYLFRASDIAQGTGNYQEAADFLETILSKHTDYKKYQDAMFSAALIYDNYLESVNHGGDRAIQLYETIEAKYPTSPYAEQAKALKTYVGKPDSVFYNDVRRKADSIEALKK